ncbi:formate/nitrite transporter family protein [Corynebacterium sp.]|uniref:formate/nitrite transporter family protein n=1 Tax=Corynebacterium sp. TaxID=1720 RepID=UPI0026E047DC|nr:formate/nitrite transporter family protein [Corynebacterium sp.]MDO5512009.1 formate/nitrite transporter family protein [Corynebacterium sp.]
MQPIHASASAAITAKVALFDADLPRFAVRSVLAGAYLTLGTAFAVVAGAAVEALAPGLGAVVFALLFGLGLFSIVVLDSELATGNMMSMSYGVVSRLVTVPKAVWLLVVCTVCNLVGALLVGVALGQAAKFTGLTPDHLLGMLSSGKLDKGPGQALVEAVLANFVVNMGVLAALRTPDITAKFFTIVPIIAIFVGLGLEHVIANFSLFSLALFSLPEVLSAGGVALNWTVVWVGNLIGGGLLIGGVYAWLNKTSA